MSQQKKCINLYFMGKLRRIRIEMSIFERKKGKKGEKNQNTFIKLSSGKISKRKTKEHIHLLKIQCVHYFQNTLTTSTKFQNKKIKKNMK